VITDVSKSIIGVDFLSHYGLLVDLVNLVDLQNSRLVDQITNLSSPRHCVRYTKYQDGRGRDTVPCIAAILGNYET